MSARPRWKLSEPDPRPGAYYTTVVDWPKVAWLSGPFRYHHEALADVQRVKDLALDKFAIAAFCGFGTAHIEGDEPARVWFNL